jgi:hypothetical protein
MKHPSLSTLRICYSLLAIMGLLAFGCEDEHAPLSPQSTDVRATIRLSSSIVAPCEMLDIEVRLTNHGDAPILITYCCDPLTYYVADIRGREMEYCIRPQCSPCTGPDSLSLFPQQTVVSTYSFCTAIPGWRMPPGIYYVHAGDKRRTYSWAVAAFAIRDTCTF